MTSFFPALANAIKQLDQTLTPSIEEFRKEVDSFTLDSFAQVLCDEKKRFLTLLSELIKLNFDQISCAANLEVDGIDDDQRRIFVSKFRGNTLELMKKIHKYGFEALKQENPIPKSLSPGPLLILLLRSSMTLGAACLVEVLFQNDFQSQGLAIKAFQEAQSLLQLSSFATSVGQHQSWTPLTLLAQLGASFGIISHRSTWTVDDITVKTQHLQGFLNDSQLETELDRALETKNKQEFALTKKYCKNFHVILTGMEFAIKLEPKATGHSIFRVNSIVDAKGNQLPLKKDIRTAKKDFLKGDGFTFDALSDLITEYFQLPKIPQGMLLFYDQEGKERIDKDGKGKYKDVTLNEQICFFKIDESDQNLFEVFWKVE